MPRLNRVEVLIGAALSDAGESHLARLVDGNVREDTDLEFKQELYGTSDAAKRDLAGDVAALANTVGGVVVIGIRDEEATAAEMTPVAVSDAEELRMRQVVASNVAPTPLFVIRRVPTSDDPSHGYYLLAVPRSPNAPHAVRVGDGLRYPRRDGAGIRWLSESEVADSYRNRFVSAQEDVQRIAIIRAEGEEDLVRPLDAAWLTMAVVPSVRGSMELTRARVRDLQSLPGIGRVPTLTEFSFARSFVETRAGHRRVVAHIGNDGQGRPRYGLLHLHTDGRGFAAVRVGYCDPREEDAPALIEDEHLTQEILASLCLLASHSVENCGASGDAVVATTIITPSRMHLGYWTRAQGAWNELAVPSAPVGRHTIDLYDVLEGRGFVVAARTIVTDLLQGFGLAESPQLTRDGDFRIRYFARQLHARVTAAAERLGVGVSDEQLD